MTRARRTVVLWVVTLLFAAACLLIAAAADSWLVPAPRFGSGEEPLVIDGERLLDCLAPDGGSIEPLPDGARLYANQDLLFHALTTGEGSESLFVVARGRPLDGVWPLLTVSVDRRSRGGFFVTSRDWGLYRFEIDLQPGDHHFRVSYVNDRSRFPTNRDLDISAIALGAPPPGWEERLRWRKESVLPGSRFSIQLLAEPEGDAVRLRNGGSLADDVFYPEDGVQKVSVRAESVGEERGRLALLVDGEEIEEFDLSGDPAMGHRATFEVRAGLRRLELVNRQGEMLVRYLMADGAAPLIPSTAEPLELGERLTIPARLLNVEAGGRLLEDGTRLIWSNGRAGRTISNATARWVRLTLLARGERCDGEGARLLLMLDDDQLETIEARAPEFMPYAIDLKMDEGEHEIMVVYVNDRFVEGVCDRNLYIRELRLEEVP